MSNYFSYSNHTITRGTKTIGAYDFFVKLKEGLRSGEPIQTPKLDLRRNTKRMNITDIAAVVWVGYQEAYNERRGWICKVIDWLNDCLGEGSEYSKINQLFDEVYGLAAHIPRWVNKAEEFMTKLKTTSRWQVNILSYDVDSLCSREDVSAETKTTIRQHVEAVTAIDKALATLEENTKAWSKCTLESLQKEVQELTKKFEEHKAALALMPSLQKEFAEAFEKCTAHVSKKEQDEYKKQKGFIDSLKIETLDASQIEAFSKFVQALPEGTRKTELQNSAYTLCKTAVSIPPKCKVDSVACQSLIECMQEGQDKQQLQEELKRLIAFLDLQPKVCLAFITGLKNKLSQTSWEQERKTLEVLKAQSTDIAPLVTEYEGILTSQSIDDKALPSALEKCADILTERLSEETLEPFVLRMETTMESLRAVLHSYALQSTDNIKKLCQKGLQKIKEDVEKEKQRLEALQQLTEEDLKTVTTLANACKSLQSHAYPLVIQCSLDSILFYLERGVSRVQNQISEFQERLTLFLATDGLDVRNRFDEVFSSKFISPTVKEQLQKQLSEGLLKKMLTFIETATLQGSRDKFMLPLLYPQLKEFNSALCKMADGTAKTDLVQKAITFWTTVFSTTTRINKEKAKDEKGKFDYPDISICDALLTGLEDRADIAPLQVALSQFQESQKHEKEVLDLEKETNHILAVAIGTGKSYEVVCAELNKLLEKKLHHPYLEHILAILTSQRSYFITLTTPKKGS